MTRHTTEKLKGSIGFQATAFEAMAKIFLCRGVAVRRSYNMTSDPAHAAMILVSEWLNLIAEMVFVPHWRVCND